MTTVRQSPLALRSKTQCRRHTILGVGVAATTYAEVCERIADAVASQHSFTVSALAVHGIMTGSLDREHRGRLNALDMLVPDGQPVRWALNALFGSRLRDRVYGPKLMLNICAMAEARGYTVGFYGNRADVLSDLRGNLLERFPQLHIGLEMPSRFRRVTSEEQSEIARSIARSGVDILFVGLGCPRQEVWLYENQSRLDIPLIAVGAAFDFHARRVAQAPHWMQDRGLEWLYRLAREPRRLWRRYLLLNPSYLCLIVAQYLGIAIITDVAAKAAIRYEGFA